MGTLTITIRRPDGTATVYAGSAQWRTDRTVMILTSGAAQEGWDPDQPHDLEYHAWVCRTAAIAAGMDTVEEWEDGFQGGRLR
jgi:hypothetical protein